MPDAIQEKKTKLNPFLQALDQIDRDMNMATAQADLLCALSHPEELLPETLSDVAHDITQRLGRASENVEKALSQAMNLYQSNTAGR